MPNNTALQVATHTKRDNPPCNSIIRRIEAWALPSVSVAGVLSIDFVSSSYILTSMLKSTSRQRAPRTKTRNPERTRKRLLQAAFQEIYKSGFRGTDLDTILRTAGVTKGAMYHHFENKEALGYAVVDEVIRDATREKWLWPLKNAINPIDTLIDIVRTTSLKPHHLACGCPLNNLSQEMAPLDEGFRRRTANAFEDWRAAIEKALRDGKKRKQVRSDVNPAEEAAFLLATYEGYISLAKNHQDVPAFQSNIRTMIRHMETLRAPRSLRKTGTAA
jgi:TetR/AcrR family transcriptional regulator, transcriptional repressor for nem operon